MREWKFWDWVTYSSLFLGTLILAGKEASTIPGLHWVDHPFFSYAPVTLFVVGTLALIAQALGWVGSGGLTDSALLRLEMFPDGRTPDRVEAKNIWRWYYAQHVLTIFEAGTGKSSQHLAVAVLYINFEKPVRVGTLKIEANSTLPRHETKEFNSRFAIIQFEGPPHSVVTIRVFQ